MGTKIDLTGQKFGRLTVLKENGRNSSNKIMWLCQCECGAQKSVVGGDLRSGRTQSCGCLHKEKLKLAHQKRIAEKKNKPGFYKDLTGQKFGKLTVLEFDQEETIKKRAEQNCSFTWWKCQCDCGSIVSIQSTALTSGKTKSCGCYQKEVAAKNMKTIQKIGAESRLISLENQRFGKLTVLKRVENIGKRVAWLCKCDCGNEIITTTSCLRRGDTQSCGCLGKSKGEDKIKEVLLQNNITFIREVKFNDLKDKDYLRFDFGILNENNQIIKLIEYDGRQHSDPSSTWYNETVILHDKMKNEYCQKQGIPLLRIPYTALQDINLEYLLSNETLSL